MATRIYLLTIKESDREYVVASLSCFRWAKEFIEALNEDKRIKETENETVRERDLHKIKILTEK